MALRTTVRATRRPQGRPPWRGPALHCTYGVEAKGLEPSNLLTASQALYQLSYAPVAR